MFNIWSCHTFRFILKKFRCNSRNTGSGANSGIVTSGLQVGDYFIVTNSNVNVGTGFSSVDYDTGAVVGVGTTFIDNVYRVAAVNYSHVTDAVGFGQTSVTQVTVGIGTVNPNLVGLAGSEFYGEYSYGILRLSERNTIRSYPVNTSNGISGILTGPIMRRKSFLKTQSYST